MMDISTLTVLSRLNVWKLQLASQGEQSVAALREKLRDLEKELLGQLKEVTNRIKERVKEKN